MNVGASDYGQAVALIDSCSVSCVVRSSPEVKVFVPPADMRQRERIASCRLLVVPDRGSWCLLTPPQMAAFRQWQKGVTLGQALEGDAELRRQLLVALYRRGMITINGKLSTLPDTVAQGDSEPTFIALHIAQGCNLRCAYCYHAATQGRNLAPQAAIALLEKACLELKSEHIQVDFLGGEPLLAWPAIVEVMAASRSLQDRYGKQIHFLMQTNGVLLTPEVVRVLLEYRVGVGVSIDGPAWLHDSQRPTSQGQPSHARVVQNMLRARELGLDVNPLAVVTRPECQADTLEYFVRELGVRAVRFGNIGNLGRARESFGHTPDGVAYSRGFLAMAERALALARSLDERLRIYNLGSFLHNLVQPSRPEMCRRSPCGLGANIISLSEDGWLYACEEYEESTRARMRLGRLAEVNLGDLRSTAPFWRDFKPRTVESIPRCSRCVWRKFCGGGCAQRTLAAYGDWYREDPFCAYYERVFPGLIWRIGEDTDYLKYLMFSD